VVGSSGCGKTFVAQALAEKLGLTYICNDTIIWRPNWQPAPREEELLEFDAATRAEGWTLDGNLGPSASDQLVLRRCDTIVWLDLPRWQVLRRTVVRVVTKEPLWHGNVERWRTALSKDSVVWWSVRMHASLRRRSGALFADAAFADRVRHRFTSRRELNEWLASLRSRSVWSTTAGRP